MVNQTPISARIDNTLLWQIEQEHMVNPSANRNRVLNQGAKMFLDYLETKRQLRAGYDYDTRRKILRGFLAKWFPADRDIWG